MCNASFWINSLMNPRESSGFLLDEFFKEITVFPLRIVQVFDHWWLLGTGMKRVFILFNEWNNIMHERMATWFPFDFFAFLANHWHWSGNEDWYWVRKRNLSLLRASFSSWLSLRVLACRKIKKKIYFDATWHRTNSAMVTAFEHLFHFLRFPFISSAWIHLKMNLLSMLFSDHFNAWSTIE